MSVRFATRTKLPPNPASAMWVKAQSAPSPLNQSGHESMIDVAYATPHLPANPLVETALEMWVEKKASLRSQLKEGDADVATAALKEIVGMDTYQPSAGSTRSRELVAKVFNKLIPGLEAQAGNCCITNGATQALMMCLQVFVERGVSVAVMDPSYPLYRKQVHSLGGKLVTVPCLSNYRASLVELELILRANPSVRCLIINDPTNPSGIKYTKEELNAVATLLEKDEFKHIIVICDEPYGELVWTEYPVRFLQVVPRFKNRTCVVSSLAKAMAGSPALRCGIIYAPDILVDGKIVSVATKISTLMLNITCALSSPVQYAFNVLAEAMLGEGEPKNVPIYQKWTDDASAAYESNRQLIITLFAKHKFFPLVTIPEGGFFALLGVSAWIDKPVPKSVTINGKTIHNLPALIGGDYFYIDLLVANFLLHVVGVVTVPGSGFYIHKGSRNNFLRVSLAVKPDTLMQLKERLDAACAVAGLYSF
eukprot:TRINITY_DN3264_c0_g1_i1.p1 TRINITY_DN3264_c0_g1~~TRINITY_DN3264_c0_g1_i1.p1  ORF type:complete len:511 (-),score=107.62 TRINITY_DN3264_c0_g1_i1:67-1506(-)